MAFAQPGPSKDHSRLCQRLAATPVDYFEVAPMAPQGKAYDK